MAGNGNATAGLPTGCFTKKRYPHFSGACISMIPCGDHTQLCSGNDLPVTLSLHLTYLPFVISVSHSTREKLMRQNEFSFGGAALPLKKLSAVKGMAISTVHFLSLSPG